MNKEFLKRDTLYGEAYHINKSGILESLKNAYSIPEFLNAKDTISTQNVNIKNYFIEDVLYNFNKNTPYIRYNIVPYFSIERDSEYKIKQFNHCYALSEDGYIWYIVRYMKDGEKYKNCILKSYKNKNKRKIMEICYNLDIEYYRKERM